MIDNNSCSGCGGDAVIVDSNSKCVSRPSAVLKVKNIDFENVAECCRSVLSGGNAE